MELALRRRLMIEAQDPPGGLTPGEYLAILDNPPRPNYQDCYLSAIRTLARLDKASPEEIAADLGPEYRQRALEPRRGLPHYIQLLQDLMRAIEAQQPRLTVVRDE
jgi:hypothetical protein